MYIPIKVEIQHLEYYINNIGALGCQVAQKRHYSRELIFIQREITELKEQGEV